MATPTPEQLGVYYTSKDLTTDGAAIPNRVVGIDSSVLSLHAPALTEATDYSNGAIGYFVGTGAATVSLRAHLFHIRKWDLATKKLALAQPLPIVPASGETFKLIANPILFLFFLSEPLTSRLIVYERQKGRFFIYFFSGDILWEL